MRYYTTVEIAELWNKSVNYAWYAMHHYGATPLGKDGYTLVWRGDDVRRIHNVIRTDGRERARRGHILAGIHRRKAKRDAAQQLKGA